MKKCLLGILFYARPVAKCWAEKAGVLAVREFEVSCSDFHSNNNFMHSFNEVLLNTVGIAVTVLVGKAEYVTGDLAG